MKVYYYFLIIATSLLIFSCESKSKKIQSNSPDGTTSIQITGTKTGLSPWALTIEVTKENKSTMVETEMHADELTDENIKFNWKTNNNCIITLIEQDGTTREIPIVY